MKERKSAYLMISTRSLYISKLVFMEISTQSLYISKCILIKSSYAAPKGLGILLKIFVIICLYMDQLSFSRNIDKHLYEKKLRCKHFARHKKKNIKMPNHDNIFIAIIDNIYIISIFFPIYAS